MRSVEMLIQKVLNRNYKIITGIFRRNIAMSETQKAKNENIVWIDLEMTGLDTKKNHILEIACIVTDKNLNIIAEGPNLIINQPKEVLDGMNDWCKIHHEASGLTASSIDSKITESVAEKQVLDFIESYTEKQNNCLAGNSVYMDRCFLMEYMPKLNEYLNLHYRIIDVSTVKELCRRWNKSIYYKAPDKILAHRALDDIKESINELKYYKQYMFNNDENEKS